VDLSTFLITVFCVVDDWLEGEPKLRQRGPHPGLADSEVLTIEIVGEFLGIDSEKDLFAYFRRHYGEWFPALQEVYRTTFTRQVANLWVAKERLCQHLLCREIDFDPLFSLVDSFPVAVCRFARAYRCRILAEESAFGYDEINKQTFYGFRAHLRVCWPGVVVGFSLAPANAHELSVAEGLLEGAKGWVLGDSNYWSPEPQRATQRARIEPDRPLQEVQEEGREEEAVAALFGAQASPDRDGVLSIQRALPSQEGAGTGSLAPGEPLAAQSVESHGRRLPLPANRILLATAFLGSPHRLNSHIGLASGL
jgi:Transposase DDE domain